MYVPLTVTERPSAMVATVEATEHGCVVLVDEQWVWMAEKSPPAASCTNKRGDFMLGVKPIETTLSSSKQPLTVPMRIDAIVEVMYEVQAVLPSWPPDARSVLPPVAMSVEPVPAKSA